MKKLLTPIANILLKKNSSSAKSEMELTEVKPAPARSVKRYSKEKLIAIASCYKTKTDFKFGAKKAYEAAQKRGLLEVIYEATGLARTA